MNMLIAGNSTDATMTNLEISELVEAGHDKMKQSIDLYFVLLAIGIVYGGKQGCRVQREDKNERLLLPLRQEVKSPH